MIIAVVIQVNVNIAYVQFTFTRQTTADDDEKSTHALGLGWTAYLYYFIVFGNMYS